MNTRMVLSALLLGVALGGCAELESIGSTKYGETSGTVPSDRNGTITSLDVVQVDRNYKLGVGTAVGAVAGGLLGSAVGDSTTATVTGAVLGGAAGTYAESKMGGGKTDAQRVTVKMSTGGTVTILQPVNAQLRNGMAVTITGSGQTARVVPR